MNNHFKPNAIRVLYVSLHKTLVAISQIIERNYKNIPVYKEKTCQLRKQYSNYKKERKLVSTREEQYEHMKKYERSMFKAFWEIIFEKTGGEENFECKRETNPYSKYFGEVNLLANLAGKFLRDMALIFYPLLAAKVVTGDTDNITDYNSDIHELTSAYDGPDGLSPSHPYLPSMDLTNFPRPHLVELIGSLYLLPISLAAKNRLLHHFLLLMAPYFDYIYAGGGRGVRPQNLPLSSPISSFNDLGKIRSMILALARKIEEKKELPKATSLVLYTPSRKKNLATQHLTSCVNADKHLDTYVNNRLIAAKVEEFFDDSREHGEWLHAAIPKLQGVAHGKKLSDIINSPHYYELGNGWLYCSELKVKGKTRGEIDGVLFKLIATDPDQLVIYPVVLLERKSVRSATSRFVGRKRSGEHITPDLYQCLTPTSHHQLLYDAYQILSNSNHSHWQQVGIYNDLLLDEWESLYPKLSPVTPHHIILLEDQATPVAKLAEQELQLLQGLISRMEQDTLEPTIYQGDTNSLAYITKPGDKEVDAISSHPSLTSSPALWEDFFAKEVSNLIPVFMVEGGHPSGPEISLFTTLNFLLDTIPGSQRIILLDLSGFLAELEQTKLLDRLDLDADEFFSRLLVEPWPVIDPDCSWEGLAAMISAKLAGSTDVIEQGEQPQVMIVFGWQLVKKCLTLREQRDKADKIYNVIKHQFSEIYWLDTPTNGPGYSAIYQQKTAFPYLPVDQPYKYSLYPGKIDKAYWNLVFPAIATKTPHPQQNNLRIIVEQSRDDIKFWLHNTRDYTNYVISFRNPSRYDYVRSQPKYSFSNSTLDTVFSLMPWLAQLYPQYQPYVEELSPLNQLDAVTSLHKVELPSPLLPASPLIIDPDLDIPKSYFDPSEITKGFTPRGSDRRKRQSSASTFSALPMYLYQLDEEINTGRIINRELLYLNRIFDATYLPPAARELLDGIISQLQIELPFDAAAMIAELNLKLQQSGHLQYYTKLAKLRVELITKQQVSRKHSKISKSSKSSTSSTSSKSFKITNFSPPPDSGSWLVLLMALLGDDQPLSDQDLYRLWRSHSSWLLYQLGFTPTSPSTPILSLPVIAEQIATDITKLAKIQPGIPNTRLYPTALLLGEDEFILAIDKGDQSPLYGRFSQTSATMIFDKEVVLYSAGLDNLDHNSWDDYNYLPCIVLEQGTTSYLVQQTGSNYTTICEITYRSNTSEMLGITRLHTIPVVKEFELSADDLAQRAVPAIKPFLEHLQQLRDSTLDVVATISIDTLRKQYCISFTPSSGYIPPGYITPKSQKQEDQEEEHGYSPSFDHLILTSKYFTEPHEAALFLKSCQFSSDGTHITDDGLTLHWDVYQTRIDGVFEHLERKVLSLAHRSAEIIEKFQQENKVVVADLLGKKEGAIGVVVRHDDDCECSTAPIPHGRSHSIDTIPSSPHSGFYLTCKEEDISIFCRIFDEADTDDPRVYLNTEEILLIYETGSINGDEIYLLDWEIDDETARIMREDYYLLRLYKYHFSAYHATMMAFNSYRSSAPTIRYEQYDLDIFTCMFTFYNEATGKYFPNNQSNSHSECKHLRTLKEFCEDAVEDVSKMEIDGELINPEELTEDLKQIIAECEDHKSECASCETPSEYPSVTSSWYTIDNDNQLVLEYLIERTNQYYQVVSSDPENHSKDSIDFIIVHFKDHPFDPYGVDEDIAHDWLYDIWEYIEVDDQSHLGDIFHIIEVLHGLYMQLSTSNMEEFADIVEYTLEHYNQSDPSFNPSCYTCKSPSIISQGLLLCEQHYTIYEEMIIGDATFASVDDWEVRTQEEQLDYWIEKYEEVDTREWSQRVDFLQKIYDATLKYEETIDVKIKRFKLRIEQARLIYREGLFETALTYLEEAMAIYQQLPDSVRYQYCMDIPKDKHAFWSKLDHSLFSVQYYAAINYIAMADTVVSGSTLQQLRYDKALTYLVQARGLSKDYDDKKLEVRVLYDIVTIFVRNNQYRCQRLLDEALQICEDINFIQYQTRFQLISINLMIKTYQFGKAYDNLELILSHSDLTDSLKIEAQDLKVRILVHTSQFQEAKELIREQIRLKVDHGKFDVYYSYYELLLISYYTFESKTFESTVYEIDDQPKSRFDPQFKASSEILLLLSRHLTNEIFESLLQKIQSNIVDLPLFNEMSLLCLEKILQSNISVDNKTNLINRISEFNISMKLKKYCDELLNRQSMETYDDIFYSLLTNNERELLKEKNILRNYCKLRLINF